MWKYIVHVPYPELSQFVQEVAFKAGYHWCSGGETHPMFLDKKYLYFSDRGDRKEIAQSDSDGDGGDARLISVENFCKIMLTPEIKVGSYVVEFKKKNECQIGCVTVNLKTAEEIVKRMREFDA